MQIKEQSRKQDFPTKWYWRQVKKPHRGEMSVAGKQVISCLAPSGRYIEATWIAKKIHDAPMGLY